MKILILYKSRHGTTKQYAGWLLEYFPNAVIASIDSFDVKKLVDFESVILGSSVYAGKILAAGFLTSNWKLFKDKKMFFFVVGMLPESNSASTKGYLAIPEEILKHIGYAKLPGAFNFADMNFMEKLIIKIISLFISKEKGKTIPMADKSFLKPVIDYFGAIPNNPPIRQDFMHESSDC